MKTFIFPLVLWLAWVFPLGSIALAIDQPGVEQQHAESDANDIQAEISDGMLTLHASNVTLAELLFEIGRLAGFKTVVLDGFSEGQRFDATFDRYPLRHAVEQLINGVNRSVHYGPALNGSGEPSIKQVWLLGTSKAADGSMVVVESQPLSHHTTHASDYLQNYRAFESDDETAVYRMKMDKMTRILQESQDPRVRSRAAAALGALGEEQAVGALEHALLDGNTEVRHQAIKALGRIGGDQATNLLGDMLMHRGDGDGDKAMAARTLEQVDSEPARNYLSASMPGAATGTVDQGQAGVPRNPNSSPGPSNVK